jgi:hypothetical protein
MILTGKISKMKKEMTAGNGGVIIHNTIHDKLD